MWFVWDGTSLWLYSIIRSQRWTNIDATHASACSWKQATTISSCAVQSCLGSVEKVGDMPRTGEAYPQLEEPEQLWDAKYGFALDGRHAWLRLTPRKIVSWDFRKISA